MGSVVIAAGYDSSLALMGSAWGLLLVSVVINSGVALAYGAMPALITGAVPPSETGSANSFDTLMRSVGTTLSAAAVVGVVLSHMTISLGPVSVPSLSGFHTGMLIGCGVSLLAAAVAACIPLRRPAAEPAAEAATPAPPRPRPSRPTDSAPVFLPTASTTAGRQFDARSVEPGHPADRPARARGRDLAPIPGRGGPAG